MITPVYVQTMSRYNIWQNNQLMKIVDAMDQAELDRDRSAFFGSIQCTLSHLLWGDQLWMSRFDAKSEAPDCTGTEGLGRWSTKSEWVAERKRTDGRIRIWADQILQDDLNGDLTWTYSYEAKQETKPLGFCVTHFFNHQAHHRGQVHAMLTAAGQDAPVSDLSYLPDSI